MTNPLDERIKNLSIAEKTEILLISTGVRKAEEIKSRDFMRLVIYCLMFSIKAGTIHPGLEPIDPSDVEENPFDVEMWSLSMDEVFEIYNLMFNMKKEASDKVKFLAEYCQLYFDETGTLHPRMKVFGNLS